MDTQPAPIGRSATAEPVEQWRPNQRPGVTPARAAKCAPGDVRFVRSEIILPSGAPPTNGVVIATIQPQAGLTYEGVWVRWGCPYEWLIREGIITISVLSREKRPYQLAEANANPRKPIWLPWCEQLGNQLEVRATWTDATVATFSRIPVWAEWALGTSDPPVFDDANENRVRIRRSALPPFVVGPGAVFVALTPGIIAPTAGKVWLQVVPAGVVTQRPQFAFATFPGSGVADQIAGHLTANGPEFYPAEFEARDLRDVFIGAPTAGAVTAPVSVSVSWEAWQ